MQIIEEMTRLDIFFRYGLVDRLEKLEDGADEK